MNGFYVWSCRRIGRRTCQCLVWGMLAAIAIGLISACHDRVAYETNVNINEPPSPAATRLISHALGKTQVPLQPQRVVTFDSTSLESSLAVGVTPVGTINTDWTHLRSYLAGVESIGIAGEPNLEKTLSLQPDLILGSTYHRAIYPQASQIAPTVLAPFDSSADWKTVFGLASEALGKSDAYDQFMLNYKARLDDFQTRLGKPLEVSVITVPADGTITVYLDQTFAGTILRDAGLQRPPSQRKSGFSERLSREQIQTVEADAIFLWNSALPGEDDREVKTAVAQLKRDPLWQQLNVVKQNRVYEVPYYWIGPGAIAANLVIDDLFRYLIQE